MPWLSFLAVRHVFNQMIHIIRQTLQGRKIRDSNTRPGVMQRRASCFSELYYDFNSRAVMGPDLYQLPLWVRFFIFLDRTEQCVKLLAA